MAGDGASKADIKKDKSNKEKKRQLKERKSRADDASEDAARSRSGGRSPSPPKKKNHELSSSSSAVDPLIAAFIKKTCDDTAATVTAAVNANTGTMLTEFDKIVVARIEVVNERIDGVDARDDRQDEEIINLSQRLTSLGK